MKYLAMAVVVVMVFSSLVFAEDKPIKFTETQKKTLEDMVMANNIAQNRIKDFVNYLVAEYKVDQSYTISKDMSGVRESAAGESARSRGKEIVKFPKSLIIGGIKWQIIIDPKIRGGEFDWEKHTIKIEKKYSDERKFDVLIHEICEAIMVNNLMRYKKCLDQTSNGDYLFSFNHDSFEIYTQELAGIMKQFMRTK